MYKWYRSKDSERKKSINSIFKNNNFNVELESGFFMTKKNSFPMNGIELMIETDQYLCEWGNFLHQIIIILNRSYYTINFQRQTHGSCNVIILNFWYKRTKKKFLEDKIAHLLLFGQMAFIKRPKNLFIFFTFSLIIILLTSTTITNE